MITFLLNLAFDLKKKLVQEGHKHGQWDVLFFDKFLFAGIIVLQKIGIDGVKDGTGGFWRLLEIVEVVRGWGIELFLKFKV